MIVVNIVAIYILGCLLAMLIINYLNDQPSEFPGLLIAPDRCLYSWWFVATVVYIFLKHFIRGWFK